MKGDHFDTKKKGGRSKLGSLMSGVGTINLHAWLMTSDMEIIDLAFATVYGIVNIIPSVIGRYSFQRHSEFNEGMIYCPQLVDEDYLKHIGAFVDFRALNIFVK